MKIQLFEKKYRKTRDHDGTNEIELSHLVRSHLFNEVGGKAYTIETTFRRDDNGRTIGKETTRTINVKTLKKEFPQCVKIKIGDLYFNL